MVSLYRIVSPLLLTAAFTLGLSAFQDAQSPNGDNTAVNKRDRSAGQPTADQGKNNRSDLQMMKDIRRLVVADKSLSTYGHNVKIIAKGGKVTLKGPVHSEDEKKAIEAKAAQVAGDGNVIDNITVKNDSK